MPVTFGTIVWEYYLIIFVFNKNNTEFSCIYKFM